MRQLLPGLGDKIVEMIVRKDRHILVGDVCLDFSCSIEQAEFELEHLVEGGKIAELDREQLRKVGLKDVASAYYLLPRR